nr:hypothetical protein CFP56_18218 [Quercus suber]
MNRWSQSRCMGWTEKRIYGFQWSNQESAGLCVELMMRAVGDEWCRKPESGFVALVYGGRVGVDDGRRGANDKSRGNEWHREPKSGLVALVCGKGELENEKGESCGK